MREFHRGYHNGFTLVELAIVLVIIGLLVGGVLQGQELIKQAQIRKDIKILGDVTLGWKTFISKYDALPGDIRNPQRFFPACNNEFAGGPNPVITGDNNGQVGLLESACIWMHLNNSGAYAALEPKQGSYLAAYPPRNINFSTDSFQYSPLGIGNKKRFSIYYYDWMKANQLYATGFAAAFSSGAHIGAMDSKIDDGKPGTGLMRVIDQLYQDGLWGHGDSTHFYSAAGVAGCIDNHAGDPNPEPGRPTTESEYVDSDIAGCNMYFRVD